MSLLKIHFTTLTLIVLTACWGPHSFFYIVHLFKRGNWINVLTVITKHFVKSKMYSIACRELWNGLAHLNAIICVVIVCVLQNVARFYNLLQDITKENITLELESKKFLAFSIWINFLASAIFCIFYFKWFSTSRNTATRHLTLHKSYQIHAWS